MNHTHEVRKRDFVTCRNLQHQWKLQVTVKKTHISLLGFQEQGVGTGRVPVWWRAYLDLIIYSGGVSCR
jgi:hypothetical protein